MSGNGPIWPADEPTNPHGQQRPSAPPPAGPPPAQPPTALPPQWGAPPPQGPAQGPAQGPPQGPPHGPPQGPPAPPYGGPPPGWGGPPGYGPPPPRKSRVGLIVASALALVLVIGLGVTGWLYFTGRFGIGPLSASDKAAAQAISDGVEKPAWASDDDVACAADELVHEHRSGDLEKRGVVKRDGDDWSYTAKWRGDDATAFYESLLDCTDDWADQVGKEWKLEDSDCLEEIGTSTIGAFFAAEGLTLSEGEDAADDDRKKAVEKLDECYLKTPAAPKATASPGYRAVTFTFTQDSSEAGDVTINTGGEGSWSPLSGRTTEVSTEEGGAKACVEAQAETTYPWGSSATSEKEFCGTAKPKRIFWTKVKKCTAQPGCYAFKLQYEGFKDFASLTATYTSNGGDCMAVSGRCSDRITVVPGGKGTVVTWSFPGSYRGSFVAKSGSLKAKIPN